MPFQSEGRDKQEMTVRLVRKQEVLTLDRPLAISPPKSFWVFTALRARFVRPDFCTSQPTEAIFVALCCAPCCV